MNDAAFVTSSLSNPTVRAILERLPSLALPDAWLVSGALFQTNWNAITSRPPGYGIKDYDIFYFDSDTSYEAEDRAIARVADAFSDLPVSIELRNQARVHLWYPAKFGTPYAPATRATDGIDRFLMHNAQVGIRATSEPYEVYAPRRFDDIEQMIVRPNRTANFRKERYEEKAAQWKARWPELTIIPA